MSLDLNDRRIAKLLEKKAVGPLTSMEEKRLTAYQLKQLRAQEAAVRRAQIMDALRRRMQAEQDVQDVSFE